MSTSTLTVTDFILARIAEDEAAARTDLESPSWGWTYDYDGGEVVGIFTPPRVLAQCAAMRKIVERHEGYLREGKEKHPRDLALAGAVLGTLGTVRDLASIWSDHPDWREEWR